MTEEVAEVDAASPAARLALAADELRAIASDGLRYAEREERHYDEERYRRVMRLAAEVMASVSDGDADSWEGSFAASGFAPSPLIGVEGAIFNGDGRILLIRREDDRLWAMPGGLLEVGEYAAAGACREVWEETAVRCRAVGLIGVYDNRRQSKRGPFHLLHLTFLCEATDAEPKPEVRPECIDVGWFAEADLPPLSPGHDIRVPDAFAFHRARLDGQPAPTAHDS